MTPSDRRAAVIQLLAEIDQQIAEAEILVSDPMLRPEEREYTWAQLDLLAAGDRAA